MNSSQDIIKEATGYCELGMFSDAWDLIESLPPEEKTKAATLDLRLQILTALSQWDLGEHLAELLLYAGESESRTVARFHHSRARAFYDIGEYQKGPRIIQTCCRRVERHSEGIERRRLERHLRKMNNFAIPC